MTVVRLDRPARLAAIADPETRRQLRDGAERGIDRSLGVLSDWNLMEIASGGEEVDDEWVGRSLTDVAAARGTDIVDVLIDVVLPDRRALSVVLPSLTPSLGRSDEGWAARVAVWQDARVVLGGSDAGAHVDLMCHANYPTVVLGEVVRDRGLLALETAVHMMTDVPARLYGLRDRGRIAEGFVRRPRRVRPRHGGERDRRACSPTCPAVANASRRRPGASTACWWPASAVIEGGVAHGSPARIGPPIGCRHGDGDACDDARIVNRSGGGGTVDGEDRPGDRGRFARRDERDRRCDLVGVEHAADGRRSPTEELHVGLLGQLEAAHQGGVDRARAHRVDADPAARRARSPSTW